MGAEENKALYRRYIEEGFNKGNVDALDELLSPDYVYHDAPPGTKPGAQGVKDVIAMFRAAFPDLNITFEDQVADETRVASRTVMHGTQTGPFMGNPPSGKTVAMPGQTLVHVKDGKITDSWVNNDVGTLFRQLGMEPPTG